ncbi:MAG: 50S ribosomal protein L18 [Pirellulales bacterium]|nr:50S ribosomal protein L18 [Pirellulales bacterium]
MDHHKSVNRQRLRRRRHVRRRVRGSAERPRLSVFRSHKHIYAQLIDDIAGRTVAAASSRDKDLAGQLSSGGNKDAASLVGKTLGERGIAAGVSDVAFDRGSYKYHGRVAALADGAREAGLKF